MLPQGATPINDRVGVINQDGHWIYLIGMHPVYRHPTGDQRSFKLTIAQLVDCGACRQVEILTAFGISKSNLDRALRRYRDGGIEAFFTRPARRGKGGFSPRKCCLKRNACSTRAKPNRRLPRNSACHSTRCAGRCGTVV